MSNVTFDSTKKPLEELLKKASEGIIQLPDFQRGWVWDDDGLRGLLASISRSFPVGALMTLRTGGEVRFKPRPIEGAPKASLQEPEFLLLDGQQRVTSLYQACMHRNVVETRNAKNQPIKRWYYIDMVLALDPLADRKEAIVGVPDSRRETRNFGREVVRDLSTPEREYALCMFPTNRLFDPKMMDWLFGFQNYWMEQGQPEKYGLMQRFHHEVVAAFIGYQLPVIELGKDTTREAVCLVFEKVNTGGKKLDAFELLTAIYAGEKTQESGESFNLREDWLGTPKQSGRRARLAAAMHQTGSVLCNLQATEFLQAVCLLHTLERRRGHLAGSGDAPAVSCTKDALLRLPLVAYRKLANRVEEGFVRAARLLFAQHVYGARDIPYQTQLVPLAAMLADLGVRWEEQTVRDRLARWYWCGVFGELYGSATESRFARDVQDFPVWLTGGDEPATVRDAGFRADRLDTMTSRLSAAYKGVQALLMHEGARDFHSGQRLEHAAYFHEKVDIHHIFPRQWCEANGIPRARYDTVVNKTPLRDATNRSLGGYAPSAYLARLQDKGATSSANLDGSLRTHLLEPNLLRADDFNAVYVARKEALLLAIQAAMGKEPWRDQQDDEPVGSIDTSFDEAELEAA